MKISRSSLFLAIRFKFSVMFNGLNLQRGNVFILVFVIYIYSYRDIVIMSSIIEIWEILLSHSPTSIIVAFTTVLSLVSHFCSRTCPVSIKFASEFVGFPIEFVPLAIEFIMLHWLSLSSQKGSFCHGEYHLRVIYNSCSLIGS